MKDFRLLTRASTWLTCVACLAFCLTAEAQEKPNKKSEKPSAANQVDSKTQKPTPKPLPTIGQERRSELIAFVNEHHPAIRPLLNSLRKNRPTDFQAAMRVLDREVKTIQNYKQRSPDRHKKLLDQWVIKSKIKLAAAQLSFKKTDKERAKLSNEIDRLINRQMDLRISLTIDDLTLYSKRMDRLTTQLQSLQDNRKTEILRQKSAIQKNADLIAADRKKSADEKKQTRTNGKSSDAKKK
ncbi:MAG: hypothetical protein ACI814_002095 [Mariniblastus sp.]|jgi:hypothetical protein